MNQVERKAASQQLSDELRENRILREFQVLIPKHRFSTLFCELTSILRDKAELEKLAPSFRRNSLLEEIENYLNPIYMTESKLVEQLDQALTERNTVVKELFELTEATEKLSVEYQDLLEACEEREEQCALILNRIPDVFQNSKRSFLGFDL